jgi:hypothetical protein
LKICYSCKEKITERKASKRAEDPSNKENSPCPRHGQNTSPRGPPSLHWGTFISLLEQNKDQAFELHAFVAMTAATPFPLSSGHEVAIAIAESVKQAIGFKFKCVVPFRIHVQDD